MKLSYIYFRGYETYHGMKQPSVHTLFEKKVKFHLRHIFWYIWYILVHFGTFRKQIINILFIKIVYIKIKSLYNI